MDPRGIVLIVCVVSFVLMIALVAYQSRVFPTGREEKILGRVQWVLWVIWFASAFALVFWFPEWVSSYDPRDY